MAIARQDPSIRADHASKEKERMAIARQDPSVQAKEKERRTTAMQDPAVRTQFNEDKKILMAKRRKVLTQQLGDCSAIDQHYPVITRNTESTVGQKFINNQENSCYANSAVNLLFNIPQFQHLLSSLPPILLDNAPTWSELKRLACLPPKTLATTQTVRGLVTEYCRSVNQATKFIYTNGDQMDSHEFLMNLFDCLSHELGKNNVHLLKRIFEVKKKIILTCPQCGSTSETEEKSFGANLQIISIEGEGISLCTTLEECFNEEFKDSKVECYCTFKEKIKETKIVEYPEVMLIQLKRWMPALGEHYKLQHNVNVPSGLSIDNHQYHLRSMTTHEGNHNNRGHYNAIVWNQKNKAFTKCSDEEIIENFSLYNTNYGEPYTVSLVMDQASHQSIQQSEDNSPVRMDQSLSHQASHQRIQHIVDSGLVRMDVVNPEVVPVSHIIPPTIVPSENSTGSRIQNNINAHQNTHSNINKEPNFDNRFYPHNLESINKNKETLIKIRKQQNEKKKFGHFGPQPPDNDSTQQVSQEISSQENEISSESNPLIEAGRKVHTKLKQLEMEFCITCKEKWFDMNIGIRSKKCQRCSNERTPAGVPKTFSAENDMDPGEQPECLKVLDTVEIAAISLICPVLSIYKVKGGSTGLKGHSISFAQNIQEFITKLPRFPRDLPYIIIKAPHQNMPLTASRQKIMDALIWLKRNNPHYKDIIIDEQALNQYPEDSNTPIRNIREFNPQGQSINNNYELLNDSENVEDELEDVIESFVPMEAPQINLEQSIRTAVLGENTVEWPERSETPVSEFQPGYFSKAHPNLFCYGLADITKPRPGKKPEYLAWIRHLMRFDNRFVKDKRFIPNAINIYRRHKSLTLGNIYAKNVCKDLTLAEVQAKIRSGDETIIKSLLSFGSQIQGTKQYFKAEAGKALSMEKWVRILSNGQEMMNLFLTFSLPDLHMPELHRLLPGHEEYLGKTVIAKLADIPPGEDPANFIDEKTDYRLRTKALNENGHIVEYFAKKKMDLVMKHVLTDVLGVVDYMIRNEYQSRKALHWHIVGRMLGISKEDITASFKSYKFDCFLPSNATEEEITEFHSEDHIKETVDKSRENVINWNVNHVGLSSLHPQADFKLWPGPEGQNIYKPTSNCLREDYEHVVKDKATIASDYEQLVNRVELHKCRRNYCLHQIPKTDRFVCRFRFPVAPKGFEIKTEKIGNNDVIQSVTRTDTFARGAEFDIAGELDTLRNHGRIVNHIPELLTIWRGNIDQKIITSSDGLLKYILKYCLKPEEGSLAFTDIVKTLSAQAAEDSPVRKLFQRILLKTVSEHDISINECHKIIAGDPYVEYSRRHKTISLVGTKRLNLPQQTDNNDTPAVKDNLTDKYWERETDENFLQFVHEYEQNTSIYCKHPRDISLYEYAAYFTEKWQLGNDVYIPHTVPNFKYIPIIKNKEYRKSYCEITLLLHRPGARPDNLYGNYKSPEEALFDFVQNDIRCPVSVRIDHLKSLKQKETDPPLDPDAEELFPDITPEAEAYQQDDWMLGLGEQIRQTDINDPEPEEEANEEDDDEYDEIETENFQNYDWNADAVAVNLSSKEQIKQAVEWIDEQKSMTTIEEVPNQDENVDVTTLNKEQLIIFDMVKFIVDSYVNQNLSDKAKIDQKLIDMSGGAGFGKTHLINKIARYAQTKSGHNNIVRIAAPTGSAASLLPGGETVHRLLKIPAENSFRNHIDDLNDLRLVELQDKFKNTIAIILDEKGMLGLGRLAQINRRLKQAKCSTEPFGGLSVILSGDLRQLPPVLDLPLYSPNGGTSVQAEGRILYKLFDSLTVTLRTNFRQAGNQNTEFRNQLERLASGKFTLADWESWKQNDLEQLDPQSKEEFINNATKLCSLKKKMSSFNIFHLKRTGHPVVTVKAQNSPGAARFRSDQAQGLMNKIAISKGAKVVLTCNLWSEAKLVNGTRGKIHSIIYENGTSPSNSQPSIVLVQFPTYTGPSYFPGIEKLVPIAMVNRNWREKNMQFNRSQFPLLLAWALSIHRSQGIQSIYINIYIYILLHCQFQE